jgi:hypothetical protein
MLIGHIFSLKLLGQSVVVLNSHKVATDLLGASFAPTAWIDDSDYCQIVARTFTVAGPGWLWSEKY